MNLWLIVLLAVLVVLGGILLLRQHAFLTLLITGLLVASLTSQPSLRHFADSQVAADKMKQVEADAVKFMVFPKPGASFEQ